MLYVLLLGHVLLQAAIASRNLDTVREAFDTVLDLIEAAIPIPGTYVCQLIEWDLELLSQKDDSEEFAVIKTHALAVGPNTLIRNSLTSLAIVVHKEYHFLLAERHPLPDKNCCQPVF